MAHDCRFHILSSCCSNPELSRQTNNGEVGRSWKLPLVAQELKAMQQHPEAQLPLV